jgi:uncharacterized membrane protein YvlD (DUF360 family)
MLTALLSLFLIGLFGLVILGIVLAVVGVVFSMALGMAGFVLFKIAPILLIGWVILKLVQRSGSRSTLSSSDRRWLDGG